MRIVSVDTVHVQEVIDELTLNGRVTFNENQVAHVYPMFGGTVTELKAEIGDFVRKGDVLAVIRSGEVADYEKQLKEAEQQLLLARRNMDATQDMYASGMASDKDVLQAKQELTSAEAEERRIKDVFSIYNYNRIDKEKQPQLINEGESIWIFMDFIREKNLKPIVFWAHMPVKEERFFGHLHRMHREFR